MKKLSCLTLLLALLISSCENEIETDLIEVKIVAEVCGNVVLQVVGDPKGLSVETWTDNSEVVYQNTFGSFLYPCDENYPANYDRTFFVSIRESKPETNCVVCLALLGNMPDQFYHTQIVSDSDIP